MGMYTNGGGTLLCESICSTAKTDNLMIKFYEMLKSLRIDMTKNGQRAYLVDCIIPQVSSNGSFFIHFGTEHKNYCDEFNTIVDHILRWFPTAEGFVWNIYEEDDTPTAWVVSNGVKHELTIPEGVNFIGYGLE